jgi:hypothetical protein
MIELSDKVWVYGMWFVQGNDVDWMACIRKVEGKWRLDYRFRHYRDDKVYDSEDEKRWFSAVAKSEDTPLEPMVKTVHEAAKVLADAQGTQVDFLLLECQGDDPKIIFHLGLRDHVHMKTPSKEEADELGASR